MVALGAIAVLNGFVISFGMFTCRVGEDDSLAAAPALAKAGVKNLRKTLLDIVSAAGFEKLEAVEACFDAG